MAQPASQWYGYHQVIDDLTKALWDWSAGHTFKVALFTSASSAINQAVSPATYTAFASDGNEVSNANGYTTGGVSVGALVRTITSGQARLSTSNAEWSPTGAGITFRAAVLYDDSDSSKRALAYCLGDSTPANYTAPAGKQFVIRVQLWAAVAWG